MTISLFNSLNIFILHRLRNKVLQLILISLDSASWELHQYSRRIWGPVKNPKIETRSWDSTRDVMIARPTLYLTTTDTTLFNRVENTVKRRKCWFNQHFLLFPQCFPKPSSLGSLKVGMVW